LHANAITRKRNRSNTVNKVNTREAKTATTACAMGHPDMAARILSACHRASMRNSDKQELLALAVALGVNTQPEFIIC
jgi:hypothetical protein